MPKADAQPRPMFSQYYNGRGDPFGIASSEVPDPSPGSQLMGASQAATGWYTLAILTGDDKWDNLQFFEGDDLLQRAAEFLQGKGLSALIQPGLAAKMQQMIAI